MSITTAVDVQVLWDMWLLLRKQGIKDKCSIRVFEGALYSLMDDEDFYEYRGCRKRINIILSLWDDIRLFALKDEVQQGWASRTIQRTEEEQSRVEELSDQFHEWMVKLMLRLAEEQD